MKVEQMREVARVCQIAGQPKRRWFYSELLDLTVWVSPEDKPIGFQLCYRDGLTEHAFTWLKERGFNHSRVDSGWARSSMKATPVLVPDGHIDTKKLKLRFEAAAGNVPKDCREVVHAALRAYPSAMKQQKSYPAKKGRK